MKEKEKNLEIFSKFNTVLSEIHSEKLTIGLQIVEAKNGMIFFYRSLQAIYTFALKWRNKCLSTLFTSYRR